SRFIPAHNRPLESPTPGEKDMTDMKKRTLLQIAALSAATAALVGCGKKEQPAPAPAPAPVAAPAPATAEPLKVAFAYVGPVGDGGWTFAHDNARKAVEK